MPFRLADAAELIFACCQLQQGIFAVTQLLAFRSHMLGASRKRPAPDGSGSSTSLHHHPSPKRLHTSSSSNSSSHPAPSPASPSGAAAAGVQRLKPGFTDLGSGAGVHYLPRALSKRSQALMAALQSEAEWQEREIVLFGRRVLQPRKVAYMADDETLAYTYSGLTLQPQVWSASATPAAWEVRAALTSALASANIHATFNSCLLNLYRSGGDHMGWHADDEALYGQFPTIASVSLGAPRDFDMRYAADKARRYRVTLSAGDVLVMQGTMQQGWQHSIPKRAGTPMPRISLTFRRIIR